MSEKNFASYGDMEALVTEVASKFSEKISKELDWSAKTWSGLTDFNGTNVWTDGENIYYSDDSTHFVLDKSTSTWSAKTWIGLTSFNPYFIWTDGENTYYSYGLDQYVLDKSTSTWSAKTWTGLTSFDGDHIWTDGENIYYSYDESGFDRREYVLDKSTSTWSQKTWYGLTYEIEPGELMYVPLLGDKIWTDGDNIYYSDDSTHFVLDKSTSTWSAKTWIGLTSFNPYFIWTDGENTYYSYGSNQYILDKSTSTWLVKTWSGLTSFYSPSVWNDGNNIYYSYGSDQYAFNKPALLRSDGFKDTTEYAKKSDIHSVPSGGTTGQVLAKSSDTDYATNWVTLKNSRVVELSETNIQTEVGTAKTVTVKYRVAGSNDTATYTSSDTSVATVAVTGHSSTGTSTTDVITITPVSNGDCTIKIAFANEVGYDAEYDYINVTVGAASGGSSVKKTRYTITSSSWSASANTSGYYTYSLTLNPTLKTSYCPTVSIAGSSDSTLWTATGKSNYDLVDYYDNTATNTLVLYAKTKPTGTFYVWVEGESV